MGRWLGRIYGISYTVYQVREMDIRITDRVAPVLLADGLRLAIISVAAIERSGRC